MYVDKDGVEKLIFVGVIATPRRIMEDGSGMDQAVGR